MRRVDSRSKDGQGECHSVGWGPKSSFCSAGHAGAGVTTWAPGFCEIFLGAEDCRTFRSFGAQSAWLLLLYCAAPRSNFWLRTVPPELVEAFATAHDVGLWQCLCAIMHVNGDMVSASAKETATFPLSMGGLGLRSAFRLRQAAHWSSWGDCLEMIRDRCFQGWGMLMDRLTSTQQEQPHSIAAARESARRLERDGFDVPTWEDLAAGLRPELPPMEDGDIYQPNMGGSISHQGAQTLHLCSPGWSHLCRRQGEPCCVHKEAHWLRVPSRACLRRDSSVSTPNRSESCCCADCASPSPLQQMHADVAVSMTCLATTGLRALSRECWEEGSAALESAAARVCREAGGRVSTNVFVRDLDIAMFNMTDSRRLEVVADGLPLFGGAQLAIDTTLVSALRGDGSARRYAASRNGVALVDARRRKERTYPELAGDAGRARLIVLAAEVGGRWSDETLMFLKLVANAKSRSAPGPLRGKARAAWFRRCSAILSCSAAKAFALSLLDRRPMIGSDGEVPHLHSVLGDSRYA